MYSALHFFLCRNLNSVFCGSNLMLNTDTDAPCIWLFWLCSDSPDQTEKNPLINTNTHTTAECSPCSFAKKIKLASGGVFVWISHAASPLHECVCLSVCPGATKYMHTALVQCTGVRLCACTYSGGHKYWHSWRLDCY